MEAAGAVDLQGELEDPGHQEWAIIASDPIPNFPALI